MINKKLLMILSKLAQVAILVKHLATKEGVGEQRYILLGDSGLMYL